MKVLVGTASWSDKSLVASKKFYPKGVSDPESRLRFYATQFPLVEVDTSYYAIPLAQTAQNWADRTPARFTMNMKAFRLFTGVEPDAARLQRAFAEAVAIRDAAWALSA